MIESEIVEILILTIQSAAILGVFYGFLYSFFGGEK
jgi:uncharacterized membrane protein YdjX (TVP38/TMEM64 family)